MGSCTTKGLTTQVEEPLQRAEFDEMLRRVLPAIVVDKAREHSINHRQLCCVKATTLSTGYRLAVSFIELSFF